MKAGPFLSPNMSLMLDLVRGLAALVVLVGHAMGLDMYTGPGQLPRQLPHDAVIVFFVLSGLVIAHSASVRTTTWRDYAIARVARIVPVAWFAILFSLAAWGLSETLGLPDQLKAPHNQASLANVLLPFVFMGESAIGQGLVFNQPYWSLAYEVWFYILFGAWLFARGPNRPLVLALLALLAGWKVLLLLPIWLMGVALVRWPNLSCVSGRMAPLYLLAGAALCVVAHNLHSIVVYAVMDLTAVHHDVWGASMYVFTDLWLGLGIALLFVGLRPVADLAARLLKAAERPIKALAGFSFTLYILHLPLLLLIRGHGIGAGDNPAVFAVMIGTILAICWLVAQQIEARSPEVRRWLTRLADQRAPAQAAA